MPYGPDVNIVHAQDVLHPADRLRYLLRVKPEGRKLQEDPEGLLDDPPAPVDYDDADDRAGNRVGQAPARKWITTPAAMTPTEVSMSPITWRRALFMLRSAWSDPIRRAMMKFPTRPRDRHNEHKPGIDCRRSKEAPICLDKDKKRNDHKGRSVDEGGKYADALVAVRGPVVGRPLAHVHGDEA